MSRSKWLSMFAVVAATVLAIGVSPVRANIIFGNFNPNPACGPASGPGHVCGITETFTDGTDTIIANGFAGAPVPGNGNTNLTLKGGPLAPAALLPINILGESGLGINSNAGPACTDPDCEISPPQSVTAVGALLTRITDAVVGSVQAGETFNFYTETTAGGPFTLLNVAGPIGATCVGPGFVVGPAADTCLWNAPAGQTRFGIAVQGVVGDVLLTEVSTPIIITDVPEPATVALLGLGLFAAGLARRRKL